MVGITECCLLLMLHETSDSVNLEFKTFELCIILPNISHLGCNFPGSVNFLKVIHVGKFQAQLFGSLISTSISLLKFCSVYKSKMELGELSFEKV